MNEITLKKSHVLSFLGGAITIKTEGHADNRSGYFVFDEDDTQLLPHDEKAGNYVRVDLPKSELIAIRDFLTRLLPVELGQKLITAGVRTMRWAVAKTG